MLSLEAGKGYSLGLKVTKENVLFETNTLAIHKIPRGQTEVLHLPKELTSEYGNCNTETNQTLSGEF